MTGTSMEYTFANRDAKPIHFLLEPWCEEFLIEPGSTISIKIYFEYPGSIRTETDPKFYTVWLWQGCRAEVFLDGKDRTTDFMASPAPL